MTNNSTNSPALQSEAETAGHLLDDWFDPIEAGLRDRVHEFIQVMIEAELEAARATPAAQGRFPENAGGASGITGHRHGHRSRSLWPGGDRTRYSKGGRLPGWSALDLASTGILTSAMSQGGRRKCAASLSPASLLL